ncbi:hypothetical protein CBW54_00535 [Yersinia kristensenii]|nr:hypothetical protein CBW54_00535 [Yersinia kristensenii]
MSNYGKILLMASLFFSGVTYAENMPVKVNVGQQSTMVGKYESVYRVVNITGMADGIIVNNVTVNRGQCRSSLANPKKPYNLPFGATQSYNYMIFNGMSNGYYNCDVIEIVVSTNQGDFTFKPN